ncbi:histidine kinase dimerization/phospho-acceptor domain-containing protein, partial [Acinetobacter baumannii]
MAQVMEIDDLTPPQRERLSVLRQSGEILLNLLNDVLDLAKIEAGKFECEWTPFEVDDLVRGAMSVYGPLARRKGLVLGAKVAPD